MTLEGYAARKACIVKEQHNLFTTWKTAEVRTTRVQCFFVDILP